MPAAASAQAEPKPPRRPPGRRPPARGRGVPLRRVATQALQVRAHVGSALVPQRLVLLHRLRDDPRELVRSPTVALRSRHRVAGEERLEDLAGGGAREGRRSRRHLVEHRAERVEVAARVDVLAASLLGGHVGDGPHHGSRARELVLRARRRLQRVDARERPGLLGQAEVEQLRLAAVGHEDVRGLDVPVDDSLGVGRIERVGDLRPEVEDALRLHRLAADRVLQRLALHPLHHDEGVALVLGDVVDHADVRMREGGAGARLARESFPRLRARGHVLGQQLEGHAAAQARVLGLVDHTHAAPSELGEDPVVGERLADHRCGSPPGGADAGTLPLARVLGQRRVSQLATAAATSFLKRSVSPSGSTTTVSPSAKRPASTSTASGFSIMRWIVRFSGRAPKTGS